MQTPQQTAQLKEELIYALGSFSRWMNRPVYKVQAFTWRMANDMQEDCPHIRLRKPYRDAANRAFRIKLARAIKQVRQQFKIILPCYDEASATMSREVLAPKAQVGA